MKSTIVIGIAAFFLAACGGDSSEDSANGGSAGTAGAAGSSGGAGTGGVAGASGASGAAGTAGSAGGAGSAGAPPGDYGVLDQCEASDPCATSFVQLIEGYQHHIATEAAKCVLAAMRDRSAGRYRHEADHTFSNGSVGTDHVILVAQDGTVLRAERSYESGPVSSEMTPDAERCELREPAYFQACLDALESTEPSGADAAWACLYGEETGFSPSPLEWFSSCAPSEPVCE
jgi:hypothetical protein